MILENSHNVKIANIKKIVDKLVEESSEKNWWKWINL